MFCTANGKLSRSNTLGLKDGRKSGYFVGGRLDGLAVGTREVSFVEGPSLERVFTLVGVLVDIIVGFVDGATVGARVGTCVGRVGCSLGTDVGCVGNIVGRNVGPEGAILGATEG